MAKDCKDNEKEIIDAISSQDGDFLFVTPKYKIEDIINKYYFINRVCPIIYRNAAWNRGSGKKVLLPCFIINRDKFKIINFFKRIGNVETPLKESDLKEGTSLNIGFNFTYGSSTTQYRTQLAPTYLEIRKEDYLYLTHVAEYISNAYAILLDNLNLTYLELKNYFVENYMYKILWKYGLKPGTTLEEGIDFKFEYSIRSSTTPYPIDDPNTIIWDENKIIREPFKRDNLQPIITIQPLRTSKILVSNLAFTSLNFRFVCYPKFDISKFNWQKINFHPGSMHDTYQDCINSLSKIPEILGIIKNEINKLVKENFWLYNDDYPEFNWNFGADFIKNINDNINQLEFSIKDKNPNDKVIPGETIIAIIKVKEGINSFQGETTFEIKIEQFKKYQLSNIIFQNFNYQAKSINDTYKIALDNIKTEVRNLIAFVFNEQRITENDFILTTDNENQKITQDITITVIIKSSEISEWLIGENHFQLNLKKFIVIKPFRQFKLINSLQQEIDLQDLNLVVASNPNDLGINYKNDFLQIENNFVFTQKNSGLNNINFNLTFLSPNAYDKYYSFIQFLISNINTNQALNLNYKIFYNNQSFNKDYNCEIFFKGINKTELNNSGNLEVQINFEKVSNWKNLIIKQIEFESNTLELVNNGQLPAPTIIQIFGSSINPYFILKNENDQILAESKINYTFESSDIFTIDSKVTEQKIIVKRNNKEINIFDKQDFTKETFIFIPPGKSKLIYQNEKGSERIYVSFEEQYLSI